MVRTVWMVVVMTLGVGYHTAGMKLNDRKIVEDLFLHQHMRVLCATSTLAMGVNLPAHLVIIKSTQQYEQGVGYREMSLMNICQMLGRAGRPQFDTTARAVILTTPEAGPRYCCLATLVIT